jgi:UDP-N-acetylmuramoyl-L-alanyl-D-glutamate--2,6-diaminopimelate ligase
LQKKDYRGFGRIATQLADYAIITDDNPRSEEPRKIIEDIKKGINGKNYRIIPGRREAIRKSLALAKEGDIVLIAGKGHEDYQILKNRALHFNDCRVARECLREMN